MAGNMRRLADLYPPTVLVIIDLPESVSGSEASYRRLNRSDTRPEPGPSTRPPALRDTHAHPSGKSLWRYYNYNFLSLSVLFRIHIYIYNDSRTLKISFNS